MIRATVVLVIANLVIPRLRQRSASDRHLCWAIALGVAAVLPLLSILLPAWQPAWASRMADWPTSLGAFGAWSTGESADVVVRATGIEAAGWTLSLAAAWVWAGGSLVALVALGRDAVRLVRVVSASRPVGDSRMLRTCADAARALGLTRSPVLLHGDQTMVPMTWGVRRPHVLLPVGAFEWPHDRLHAVCAHELAHVRRADWLVHVLAQMVCAVYWFNPLFWMAERALGRESEQAADDEALASGLDASQYAAHVVALVRQMRVPLAVHAPVVAMGRPSQLERRVAALLRADANRTLVSPRRALLAAVASAVLVIPLATVAAGREWFDVDVRTVEPPSMLRSSGGRDAEPMLPIVRAVGGAGSFGAGEAARFATGGKDTLPVIAEYTTPPLYSDVARRRHIEGVVTIGGHVDEVGRLSGARVVKGLGAGLDENALVALRQWRFVPGSRAGRRAAMDVEIDIEFSLQNEAVNELIANDMATLVGPDVIPPRAVRTSRAPLDAGPARGSVVLDVVLLQDGSPKIVRILQSLTPEADEQAVRHFEQWRFTPAMKNGAPVKVRMNAEVRFHG
jgi:TonB family protein